MPPRRQRQLQPGLLVSLVRRVGPSAPPPPPSRQPQPLLADVHQRLDGHQHAEQDEDGAEQPGLGGGCGVQLQSRVRRRTDGEGTARQTDYSMILDRHSDRKQIHHLETEGRHHNILLSKKNYLYELLLKKKNGTSHVSPWKSPG